MSNVHGKQVTEVEQHTPLNSAEVVESKLADFTGRSRAFKAANKVWPLWSLGFLMKWAVYAAMWAVKRLILFYIDCVLTAISVLMVCCRIYLAVVPICIVCGRVYDA